MSGVAASFSALTVGYGSVPVLHGISGGARPGDLTVLIGPNGSGKSTLLRALAGLLPYGGSLRLGERELSELSRRELGRIVGVVPQQIRMAAPFTVREAVTLGRLPWQGLAARRSEEDERRIAEAVVRTDTEHLLLRPVTRLSGGETQRVMLATVLAQETPVVLLDEPASALDPLHATRTFSLLKELAGEGRTIIAAVHDVNLAAAFADVFFALKDGRVVAEGTAAELDENVLRDLYGIAFEAYRSPKGKRAWHTFAE